VTGRLPARSGRRRSSGGARAIDTATSRETRCRRPPCLSRFFRRALSTSSRRTAAAAERRSADGCPSRFPGHSCGSAASTPRERAPPAGAFRPAPPVAPRRQAVLLACNQRQETGRCAVQQEDVKRRFEVTDQDLARGGPKHRVEFVARRSARRTHRPARASRSAQRAETDTPTVVPKRSRSAASPSLTGRAVSANLMRSGTDLLEPSGGRPHGPGEARRQHQQGAGARTRGKCHSRAWKGLVGPVALVVGGNRRYRQQPGATARRWAAPTPCALRTHGQLLAKDARLRRRSSDRRTAAGHVQTRLDQQRAAPRTGPGSTRGAAREHPSVDVASAPNASTQTDFGVADLRTHAVAPFGPGTRTRRSASAW
jgi:hypothetical protein